MNPTVSLFLRASEVWLLVYELLQLTEWLVDKSIQLNNFGYLIIYLVTKISKLQLCLVKIFKHTINLWNCYTF